ncbi:MAG: aminotransferase class I/II-fold pyridoxal phosphate-dependent enzyme [Ruminococcus sp.]|nr:aminotransferase class I/II-fold pyridoxal phosphate-dependent enzyme [Ruminococcus sp.]
MRQEHGGIITADSGFLDLSVNLNPLGMPERVSRAVISASGAWENYPDPDCTELTEKIAAAEGTSPRNIVCGNGADDLIYRIAHAFKPAKAVITAPTFGEYAKALRETDCTLRERILLEENNFLPDDSLLDELTPDIDIAFICSPNNPTGQIVHPQLLEKAARKCLDCGIMLICDECFLSFAENADRFTAARFMNENIIILRSFTKLYCMAGLRLGYAVCGSEGAAERLRRSGQYWSVSAPAQAAGIAALDEKAYAAETVSLISKERSFLAERLNALGYKVFPSAVNYLLFKGEEGLDDRLLAEGIGIRNCASYSGLGSVFFRAAVRTHEENQRFINALERINNVKS